MDAPEELLLLEGVCWQLGIISYHPEVQFGKTNKSAWQRKGREIYSSNCENLPSAGCPSVPNECVTAQVQMDCKVGIRMQQLFAEGDKALIEKQGLQMVDKILPPS